MSINHFVTLSNPDNPISTLISLSYKFLDPKMQKITNFFIQRQKLFTDFSFIFPIFEEKNFNYLNELQTDFLKGNENDKKLFEINFYSSNMSKNYYRKYIKVFDIISYLGGITKLLSIIFSYLNENFCNLKLLSVFMDNFPKFANKNQQVNAAENDQKINENNKSDGNNNNNKVINNNKSGSLQINKEANNNINNYNNNSRNIIELENKNNLSNSKLPIIRDNLGI